MRLPGQHPCSYVNSICNPFTTEVPSQDYKTTPEETYLAGAPTLKMPTISAKIHSGDTSHPPSEGFKPLQNKPRLDNDTQPDGELRASIEIKHH